MFAEKLICDFWLALNGMLQELNEYPNLHLRNRNAFLRLCKGCVYVWDPEGVILEGMLLNVVGSKPEGMVSADKAKNIESGESGTLLLDEDDETDILLNVEVVVVNKIVGWDSVTGIEEVNGKRCA
ncbi:hypothetical protein TNCV_4862351 [Trichonephila clavipes]|nr:hypothetical protein TNCV_4862351 [Trichonephila clavipes]